MTLSKIVPDFLKLALRPIYRVFVYPIRKISYCPKSRDELQRYWRQPWDDGNLPQDYLKGEASSQFLVEIMKSYSNPDTSIIEIGCNIGRNLNYCFSAGFKKLSGIELNENAVELMKKSYPEMSGYAKIYNTPVEEVIRDFKDGEFGIVFTMAVLEHIHYDSEWIFPEIVRITKNFLITIEDERCLSWRHLPRNYKKVFESLGMKQIREINCSNIKELGSSFFARIFKKS